jgi:hypothetical protein
VKSLTFFLMIASLFVCSLIAQGAVIDSSVTLKSNASISSNTSISNASQKKIANTSENMLLAANTASCCCGDGVKEPRYCATGPSGCSCYCQGTPRVPVFQCK